jgi:signal transduction histidine kinase
MAQDDGDAAARWLRGEPRVVANVPPSSRQRRTARILVLALLAILAATWPFATIRLPAIDAFVPSLAAALCISDMVTAVLLFSQFAILRRWALLAIANGYLFSAFIVIAHALAFPGAFSRTGLFGAGLQSAVWLYWFWHAGLPLAVIAYVLLGIRNPAVGADAARVALGASMTATIALVAAMFWFVTQHHDLLPVTFVDVHPLSLFRRVIGGVVDLTLGGIALCLLWLHRKTLLDEWLVVALCALLIEVALASILSGDRYTVSWYAGRFYQLVTATVVMAVLLTETSTLYADVARAAAQESERRYREMQMELAHANRVATMGQLSASIAHEVSQPIAGTITNARAALRLLEAEPHNVDGFRRTLERIVRDGNRAGEVVDRVRALVKKAPPRKDLMDVNDAIREVVRLTHGEASRHDIAVETQLANDLPKVEGDRVQLQQVVLNLIVNATEAMSTAREGSRRLLIRAAPATSDCVLVTVQDSGPGIDPANLERIFGAFYTTKPDGLGMGLSICRAIIEAHGGRLWATNEPGGALFQFTLPSRTGAAPLA